MAIVTAPVRHFFVDEAGDLTLFDKRGSTVVGTEGSSHTFMVGVCELPDPAAASTAIEALRAKLLADPWFRKVPSMQTERGKTALAFHAKDDVSEVRREVFSLLPTFGAKMYVAIRRKLQLAMSARDVFERTGKKFAPNQVYDDLVKRGFNGLLHKAEENRIMFSRRGKTDRNAALVTALDRARDDFNAKWKTDHNRPVIVTSGVPSDHAGLQVVDYYLWALQRMIERREDRYFELVAPSFRIVMDLDDRRAKQYGAWYSDRNPLTLDTMMPVAPG